MSSNQRAVLETAIKAATAYGRDDLARRLTEVGRTLDEGTVRVIVVGEFKQGKSSLVNGLLNARVCPVDDDVATSVPTIIRYRQEPTASLLLPVDDRGGKLEKNRQPIDVGSLPVYASELGNPGNEMRLLAVDVGLPRDLLAGGITFIDTPGVGGLGSAHTAATLAALPTADVVLFVSDASQELTQPEFEFLEATARGGTGADVGRATSPGPACAFVLTKTDFYPDWRRVADLDRGHLKGVDEAIPVFPTSALLRTTALEAGDRDLNRESGYPQLIDFIRTSTEAASGTASAAVVNDLRSVVGQLHSAFETERQILEDPEQIEAISVDFERAKERTAALRDQTARWQVTLNDGVADLTADFDFRLRARLRTTVADAEATIDEEEPGDVWDEFTEWLRRRVSTDLALTYAELMTRAHALSRQVAEHFDDGEAALAIDLDSKRAIDAMAEIEARADIDPLKVKLGTKALTAMRGSYGGLLMFGMVAQLAGLALLNPATAGVGLLMGRKAIRDERERLLTAQRQKAKATTRQFVDDASLTANKEIKETMRLLHRQLRDHYQGRAKEMQRSVSSALAAAKEAVNADQRQRRTRLGDVEAELGRLDQLSTRIDRLAVPTDG
ncbi:MAG: dynamin family protein [Actinomycetota bacterium]